MANGGFLMGLCLEPCGEEETHPPTCLDCPLGETIYFWYNYTEGPNTGYTTTLMGPIAVAFDPVLGGWQSSYPQGYDSPPAGNACIPASTDLYHSQIGVAFKPGATDCHVWMHAAVQMCAYISFCAYTPRPSATPPAWIPTDPGDQLELDNDTGAISGCTPGGSFYWDHSVLDIDISDCDDNIIYEHPGNFWAWTRTTAPPGI